jgi:hypothetical protein
MESHLQWLALPVGAVSQTGSRLNRGMTRPSQSPSDNAQGSRRTTSRSRTFYDSGTSWRCFGPLKAAVLACYLAPVRRLKVLLPAKNIETLQRKRLLRRWWQERPGAALESPSSLQLGPPGWACRCLPQMSASIVQRKRLRWHCTYRTQAEQYFRETLPPSPIPEIFKQSIV